MIELVQFTLLSIAGGLAAAVGWKIADWAVVRYRSRR